MAARNRAVEVRFVHKMYLDTCILESVYYVYLCKRKYVCVERVTSKRTWKKYAHEIDRERDRQTDRQTDRDRDRETERQRERERQRDTESNAEQLQVQSLIRILLDFNIQCNFHFVQHKVA